MNTLNGMNQNCNFDNLKISGKKSLGEIYEKINNGEINFSVIKFIRSNPWPLILENTSFYDNELIQELQNKTGIPNYIIVELFSILQAIGHIPGVGFEISKESQNYFKLNGMDPKKFINDIRINTSVGKEEFIKEVSIFLNKLSNLQIIEKYKENNENNKTISNGLFRITSLYDMNYSKFKNLNDFLDFLFINISIQDNFFGNQFIDMVKETSGLPVDDIEGRETTKFSKDKFVSKLGTINFNGQNIDLLFRIIPGFSPNGIGFNISLDLKDVHGESQNNNYMYLFALCFEKISNSITPVIHTIQNSFHNIGTNMNGKLFHINEPLNDEIKKDFGVSLLEAESSDSKEILKLKKKLKYDLINSVKSFTSGLDAETEFLALILDKIFANGFNEVRCINGKDNLWLSKHNVYRTAKSLDESINSMYNTKIKPLNYKEDNVRGDYIIDSQGVIKYLGRFPNKKNFSETAKIMQGLGKDIVYLGELLKKENNNKELEESIKNISGVIDNVLKRVDFLHKRIVNVDNFLDVYNNCVGDKKNISTISDGIEKGDNIQKNLLLNGIKALKNDKNLDLHVKDFEKMNSSKFVLENALLNLSNIDIPEIIEIKNKINDILKIKIENLF